MGLDHALPQPAQTDLCRARLVALPYFGGMPNEAIASVPKVSANTVVNNLAFARTKLRHQLKIGVGSNAA